MKKPDAAAWMAARGWSPFPFQREVWDAMARGESGLLHATTGAGKTYAVWLGALQALADTEAKRTPPLTVVWLTPMRALAADTLRALTPLAGYAPELLIVSLGVDTYAHDPISHFKLDRPEFARLGRRIAAFGAARTLFLQEGGYATEAIGHNVVAVLQGFQGGLA